MMAAAGMDWVFIDTEHGGMSIETIQDLVLFTLQTSMTPVVRVADFQYDLVARVLDIGAEGVIFPRCEDPAQLAKVVSWTKFPPQGIRGFGLTPPAVGFSTAPFPEVCAHQNEETLVIAQVETVKALEAREELAAVEGVDALLVGPADLSISLGVGGQWDDPKFETAVDQVIETCNRHGKFPAIQVRNAQLAEKWQKRGMRLIGCGNEQAILWNAINALATQLKPLRD